MAARKPKLTQYKVRAQFGSDRVSQAVYFVWAKSERQALRTVREVAPRVDVVEVERIGKLVPVDDAPRPTKVPMESGPVLPQFASSGRRVSHVE
jgi:DNA polymerase III alpha subunit